MNAPKLLHDATVQEIQLELIRRTTFNDFHGERVFSSLHKHRHLWQAVLLDRTGVPNYATPRHLLTGGLITLRDLPENLWNADTLFVLTRTRQAAEELKGIIAAEVWGGETTIHDDWEETDMALGTGRQKYGLLSVWWD
jgi:hypothetical protein